LLTTNIRTRGRLGGGLQFIRQYVAEFMVRSAVNWEEAFSVV
jgi:hypothetical protein